MKKQKTPILLLFIMLISPIASAFDHCSNMAMSIQLSESPSFNTSAFIQYVSLLEKQEIHHNNDGNNHQRTMNCQTGYSCSFQTCAGYAITPSSAMALNTVISLYYPSFEYFSPSSTNLSPALRPPIFFL